MRDVDLIPFCGSGTNGFTSDIARAGAVHFCGDLTAVCRDPRHPTGRGCFTADGCSIRHFDEAKDEVSLFAGGNQRARTAWAVTLDSLRSVRC